MNNRPSDQLLAEFQKYLNSNLGLHYSSRHEKEVLRKLTAISKEFEIENSSECISWLINTPVTRTIIEKLAIHFSIGETFFFREPKSFEYLEKIYLPALIRQRSANGKYLRIWSAGVASGEEIYSIAILLRQLIPNPKSWNISLLATDISPVLMEKAKRGIYSKWSFRHNKYPVDSYFTPAGENKFLVSDAVREMVRFSWLNLAEPVYPAAATNTLDMDIIFCRNVMIYFSGDVIGTVTDRFYQCLVKGGILVVSPADMTPYISDKFSRVVYSGYTIYHKGKKKARVEPAPTPSASPGMNYTPPSVVPEKPAPFTLEELQQLFEKGSFTEPESRIETQHLTPVQDTVQQDRETKFLLAKTKANLGEYDESAILCEELLKTERTDYRIHYFYATILSELGKTSEAIASLNKAIYLEKDFPMGHYLLGNLVRKQNGNVMSEKHFRHLQKILLKMDPQSEIPESGGLTASKFIELVNSNL